MEDIIKNDERLFEHIARASSQLYIYYTDFTTNISRWCKPAVEYFGLPKEYDTSPDAWFAKIHPDDLPQVEEEFRRIYAHETPYHNREYRIANAKGEYVWVNCRGYMSYDDNNQPLYFAGYVVNLGTTPKVDYTTGLWTFRGYMTELKNMLEFGTRGALMQFNIAGFKKINSDYGYDFGDKVLFKIAQTIDTVFNGRAKVFRFEGVQFGAMYTNNHNHNSEQIKEVLNETYFEIKELLKDIVVNGIKLSIEMTAGAILFPDDGAFFEQISSRLVYVASYAKHNNIRELLFYNDDIFYSTKREFELREALNKSIDSDFRGFRIVLQPIVSADNERLEAAEVLLRWTDEKFPKTSPAEFIPVLEQTRGIIPVGKWIIDQSLATLKKWDKIEENRLPCIHINVAYVQFMEEDFVEYVLERLEHYDLAPGRLVLELTESCRIKFSREFNSVLRLLSDCGVKIALDDFGTGYSSLSILKQIPVDIVKIDHTMIKTVVNRPKDRDLVKLIVGFSDRFDIAVCAEGVETQEVLNVVKGAGAAYIQGYYYDKPLEIDEFDKKYIE